MSKAKTSKVAEYLNALISISEKSQRELSELVGFNTPNMITMIKQGHSKLPIDKVEPMARALNVDPMHLLKMCMTEYYPNTWNSIESIVGYALTENEKAIINIVRDASDGTDPRVSGDSEKKALVTWVKSVMA